MKPRNPSLQDQLAELKPKISPNQVSFELSDEDLQNLVQSVLESGDSTTSDPSTPSDHGDKKRQARFGEPFYLDNEGKRMFDQRKSQGRLPVMKIQLADGMTVEVPLTNPKWVERYVEDGFRERELAQKAKQAERISSWVHTGLGIAGIVAMSLGIVFGVRAEVKKKE